MQVNKQDPLAGAQSGQNSASPVRGASFGRVFCLLRFIGSCLQAVVSHIENLSGRWLSQKTVFRPGVSQGLQPGQFSVTLTSKMSQVAQNTNAKAKVILAKKVSVKSAGSGDHGALFILGEAGARVAVLKPEEQVGIFDPLKQKGLLLSTGVKDPLMAGEMASHLISEAFGFNLVPETAVVQSEGKSASVQVFAEGFSLAAGAVKARLNAANPQPPLTEKEKFLFQKMACLDFLLGNSDRHSDNWMVKTDNQGCITDIKLIDNGASLPRQHVIQGTIPGDFFRRTAAHNQYNWATFKASEEGFTGEMKTFIENLSSDDLEEAFNAIDGEQPNYLTEEMKTFAHERLTLLKKAAAGSLQVTEGEGSRLFQVRDLFLFMDKRQCDGALAGQSVSWTPQLQTSFQVNRDRNVKKGRQ
jgi:hypothetical protein